MEDVAHCIVHRERPTEYMCPACHNRPLCKMCGQEHAGETGHAPENCELVGMMIMSQRIKDTEGSVAKVQSLALALANEMVEIATEFQNGIRQVLDGFQSDCLHIEELRKMHKLNSEGRYAELYLYAKSLPAGGAKNIAEMEDVNKRLLKMIDTSSSGLGKLTSMIAAAQYKPIFSAYNKDEVLMLTGGSFRSEKDVASALHSADMSAKVKAVYIDPWYTVGDGVASELASRLQTHPISAIYLKGRYISDVGAGLLAEAAFRNSSISAFCIWGSKISDKGAKAVAEAARGCRSLTALYIAGWEISDSGAVAVAEAAKSCPAISVFHLGSNRISDSGAKSVAETVKGCMLSAFCLWSSEISDAGATSVADKVKDCPLSVFYLGGRKISDSGAAAMATTLSSGGCASTLSAFCFWSFDASNAGAKKIADAIKSCTKLSEFYLCGNPVSGVTVAHILAGMAGSSGIRSVNLRISEINKGKMDSGLKQLQQSGVATQLKLRLECDTKAAKSTCNKFAAEWNAKLDKFMIVGSIVELFENEVILGVAM